MGFKRQTETAFLQTVIELAELRGWRVYHTHDSRRSQSGFPDLVMVRQGRLVLAELKVGGNVTTDAQRAWLADLFQVAYHVGAGVVGVYEWRPADWKQIEEVLR